MRLYSKRIGFNLSLAGFLLVCAVPATSQVRPPVTTSASEGGSSIRGRVTLPDGSFLNESIRITLQTARGTEASIFSDSLGRFEFPGLRPGSYQIVAEGDRRRYEVVTESVELIRGFPSNLTIALKEKENDNSGREKYASGVVSTSELDPNIPAAARKEFERARGAGNQGRMDEAIQHLRKAIEIYPSFLMAHNDLGARLLAHGQLEEAGDEFHKAIDLDPKAFNPSLNLGIVLVHQHKFLEAIATLRKAISLEPNAPAARLFAGLALAGLNDFPGAELELKAAHDLGGPAYALALFHLGHVYLNAGEREQAVKMFESYLHEAPNAANANDVRKLIGTLR